MAGRPRTVLIAVLVVVNIGFTARATVVAKTSERYQIVVFYADETTPQAVRSANYTVLLSALQRTLEPAATTISDNLVSDAKVYPASIYDQTTALLSAARARRFDLAVFTNALALRHRYLLYRASTGREETPELPTLPPAQRPALTTSPLSRPEYFQQSLGEIAKLYPTDSLDVILFTNSHGSSDFALTPLVSADLTNASESELSAAVAAPSAIVLPHRTTYLGTTKLEYWRVLATISGRGVRFPLVFRQACKSGVSSWRELLSLPASVGVVAHTADERLDYSAIDYAKVFERYADRTTLVAHVAKELRRQHIYVSNPADLWVGLVFADLVWLSRYLLFVPVAMWVLTFAFTRVRNLKRHVVTMLQALP